MNLYITNITANLPQGLVPDTSVLIQDGRIADIGSDAPANIKVYDGGGLLLSPGFIDLHSDAIEKEIRPRPAGHSRIPLRSPSWINALPHAGSPGCITASVLGQRHQ